MSGANSKDSQIRKLLLSLAEQRGSEKTFCPSEVARSIDSENWRALMDDVREVAAKLISQGHLVCKQRGQVVEIEKAFGPIRLQQSQR